MEGALTKASLIWMISVVRAVGRNEARVPRRPSRLRDHKMLDRIRGGTICNPRCGSVCNSRGGPVCMPAPCASRASGCSLLSSSRVHFVGGTRPEAAAAQRKPDRWRGSAAGSIVKEAAQNLGHHPLVTASGCCLYSPRSPSDPGGRKIRSRAHATAALDSS